MSKFPEFEPSKEALGFINEARFQRKYDFPFATMNVGRSIRVGKEEVRSLGVLRTMASKEGMKLNRVFRVIDHGDSYEVFYQGPRTVGTDKE